MKNSKRMRNAAVYSGKKPNGSSNANIRKHSKFRKQDYIKEKSEPYSAEDMVKALEEVADESGAEEKLEPYSAEGMVKALEEVIDTSEANVEMDSQKRKLQNKTFSNKLIVPVCRRSKISKETILPVVKPTGGGKKLSKENSFSIEDFSVYEFAQSILEKYSIYHLDPSERTLWIHNGKAYEPLNDRKLGDLIYMELPKEIKIITKSSKKLINDTIEYITKECTASPIDIKLSSKYYKTFTEKDIRSIYNQVVLENGIYDAKTGEFQQNFDATKPYYYVIHAKYLEEASDDELETPYFDQLLIDATGGDEASIEMIMEALGMLLLPNKCKKFIVAGNASNSGKSVLFGQFLDSLFDGTRISRVDSSKLGGRFALGNCADKLLISCLDIDEKALSPKAVGIVKRATVEYKISVEAKYKDAEEIIVRFKFVFATNFGFSSQRYDPGLVNRIIALPFIHETLEKDQCADLPERLQEEKDKIVTKILRKMQDIIDSDGSIGIKESSLSQALKTEWTIANTFFADFCEQCLEVTDSEDDYVSLDELYTAYKRFCVFKKDISSIKEKYEILTKTAFDKCFREKYEIDESDAVQYVRRRRFGNEEYKHPVRRIIKIRLLN